MKGQGRCKLTNNVFRLPVTAILRAGAILSANPKQRRPDCGKSGANPAR